MVMYYIYFINNFGKKTLVHIDNKKETLIKAIQNELTTLDPDTNRQILITTNNLGE